MKMSLAMVVMLGTMGLTMGLTPTAHAERLTLQIWGDIVASDNDNRALLQQEGVVTGRFTVVYESEAIPDLISVPDQRRTYFNTIEKMVFEFLDEDNVPVTLPFHTDYDVNEVAHTFGTYLYANSLLEYNYENLQFTVNYRTGADISSQNYMAFQSFINVYNARNYFGDEALPILPKESDYNNQRLTLKAHSDDAYTYFYLRNVEHHYFGPDNDNDGVMNFYDECAASIQDATLTIDGVNTGIANGVDIDGCSIADHFAACEAQQAGSFPLFYSGPTACENGVLYDAYRNGLITYPELRQLRQML